MKLFNVELRTNSDFRSRSFDLFPPTHSPAGAIADEREYFDISAGSLEIDCERMKLDSSFGERESGEYPSTSVKPNYSEIRESPDEQLEEDDMDSNTNSRKFIV